MVFWKKSKTRQAPSSSVPAASDANTFLQQSTALIPAEVRMISGCHSEQTSADLRNVQTVANQLPNPAGRAGGACTSALLDILYQHGPQNHGKTLTFQDLLLKMRESLARSGLSQIPQLTSSRPLDVKDTPFHLVGGNGRRRALLVGINYRGQNGELTGCHNDVFNMKKYIMKVHGFPAEDIVVLVDDDSHSYPTRQKIIAQLRHLVAVSMPGDSVYFHYSGHGGLLDPDFNVWKEKTKEYDETLYPLDHSYAGQIRDFSLFNHFVKPMKAAVTVTCVIDACHSGSVLDLPYSFRPTPGGEIRMRSNMGQLSNLAFLYILAGGMLPRGLFHGMTTDMENTLGGSVDEYQGTGLEAADADGAAFGEGGTEGYSNNEPESWGGMDGDAAPGGGFDDEIRGLDGDVAPDAAGIDGGGPVAVQGEAVPDDMQDPGFGDAVGGLDGDVAPGVAAIGGGPVVVQGEPVPDMQGPGFGDAVGGLDGAGIGGDPVVVQGEPVPDMQDPGFGEAAYGEPMQHPGYADAAQGDPYGDRFDYDGGADDADCGDCGECGVADILDSLLDNA